MSSCRHLLIICEILRAVASFLKSRIVSVLSRVVSVLSCCLSVVTCCLSVVTCCVSAVTYCLSAVTCCVSTVTCCLSVFTCCVSAVTCCLNAVTYCLTCCLSAVLFKITCSPLFPDMLAVPDFLIGAMEEWGLVMFRRSYLVYDEQFCSTDVKLAMTKVIAHELAHQVIYAANHLAKMVSNIIFQTTVKLTAPSESMMR